MSIRWPLALRRIVLPAISGCLALLAPAQGQTPQPSQPESETKIRILSVSTPPLAGKQLPDGGLIPALVNASLGRAGPGTGTQVRWTNRAFTQKTLNDPSIDLFLPVESADCDHPNDLAQTSAVICDHAVYSEPIFQIVLGLFTLTDSDFKFENDNSALGKTLCISREQDRSALDANGRNWAEYKRVTVMQRPTLLDCVVAVQAHEADAFVAFDLAGRHLLARLGLTSYFAMQPRPLATRGVHAVVSHGHPRGPDILNALNRGLKQLKASDAYAAIVQKHLNLTPVAASVAAPQAAQPAAAQQQAASPAAARPQAASPADAQPQLPPAALMPARRPILDAESRKRALRYLKRGEQELADGRVAPARLLYERAAEMGLAEAAMALAATYDATELDKPHLRNVLPDPVAAKRWYERARLLGADEAATRLQRLGSR